MITIFEQDGMSGSRKKLDKERSVFAVSKITEDASVLGYVKLSKLKQHDCIPKSRILKSNENIQASVFLLNREYYVIHDIPEEANDEYRESWVRLYLPVVNKEGTLGYIEVVDNKPLWLSLVSLPLLVIGMALLGCSVVYCLVINRAEELKNAVPETESEAIVTYVDNSAEDFDDSVMEITSKPGESEQLNAKGDISINLYSYNRLSKGESLPLTNYSTNIDALQYIIEDAESGLVYYRSKVLAPGKQDSWDAPSMLEPGEYRVNVLVDTFIINEDGSIGDKLCGFNMPDVTIDIAN